MNKFKDGWMLVGCNILGIRADYTKATLNPLLLKNVNIFYLLVVSGNARVGDNRFGVRKLTVQIPPCPRLCKLMTLVLPQKLNML